MDILSIALGFLEGFALIISPCILPVLPIILATSVEGSRSRPYGIILGFILTFSLFTFFARSLVLYTGINLEIIRNISFVLLILFGVIMISTYLTEKFSSVTAKFSNVGSSISSQTNFFTSILIGGLIGIVWTPCAGPVLAAVIVQTVLQKTTLNSFLIVLAFGIGAGIPMLLIAIFGRSLMNRLGFFKQHGILFRKILGVIIIASVVYLLFGETLTNAAPSNNVIQSDQLQNGISPIPAPPIGGISAWINSPPLSLEQLKGKVVLIDFWTYSCINCLRTLPYLKDWYEKYRDKGFVIIGVHTPEFDFEKNIDNIKKAVQKYGITYPVASDDKFVTWQNFHNQYWPAHYLIDKNGNIVYEHFGEGAYDVTENNIRYLLGIKSPMQASSNSQDSYSFKQSPETYLGYARAQNFASRESLVKDQVMQYSFPNALVRDQWALRGPWIISADKITSGEVGAAIKLRFYAKKVFVVMANPTGNPIPVKVLLNGEELVAEKGQDVNQGKIVVTENRLYEVVQLPDAQNGILILTAGAPGLEIYTFTFG